MTTLLELKPTRTSSGAHREIERNRDRKQNGWSKHLANAIEYFPGLPYQAWKEMDFAPRSGEWRVLTVDEEQFLFRQMNLALYRAECLRLDVLSGVEPPESLDELNRLVQRAHAIRNELVQAFVKLNFSLAGRFTNQFNSFDELASEGNVVLMRAIERFNPERGFRFSTYAMHAIRRRLLRYVKSRHRRRQTERTWNEEEVGSDKARWTLAYERHVESAMAIMERLLPRLAPRERYILRARFGWGREFDARTLQQVADEFGVSRERIRQLESRALKKLRALAKEAKVEGSFGVR